MCKVRTEIRNASACVNVNDSNTGSHTVVTVRIFLPNRDVPNVRTVAEASVWLKPGEKRPYVSEQQASTLALARVIQEGGRVDVVAMDLRKTTLWMSKPDKNGVITHWITQHYGCISGDVSDPENLVEVEVGDFLENNSREESEVKEEYSPAI